MKLFYAPGACSLAAHIVLEEIGAPFEGIRLNLIEGEQRRPDYLAINPKGRVPALATTDSVLTESPAILIHLADAYPTLALLPAAPWARAQAISFLAWCSGTVHGLAFAGVFRPARFSADETAHAAIRAHALESVKDHLAEIEQRLTGKAFMFDAFSVADLYPLIFRRWAARVGIDMAAYPALVAHADRLAQRPAIARVLERESIKLDG
jgi:glutathione S-transferase